MAPSFSLSYAAELPSQLSSATPLVTRSPRFINPGLNPGLLPTAGESHFFEQGHIAVPYGHRARGTPRPDSSLRLPIAVDDDESSANGLAGGTASAPRSPVESRRDRSYYSAWHCRALGLHACHPASGLQSWGKGDMPDEDASCRQVRMKTAYAEDPDEIIDISQVASRQATTDLIAACAAVQKCRNTSKRFVACPLPNGSGSKRRTEIGPRSGSRSQGRSRPRVASSKRYVREVRRDSAEVRREEAAKAAKAAAKAEADMERVRMASEFFLNSQLQEEREEKCRYYALVFSKELYRWKTLSEQSARQREKIRAELEEEERRWRELSAPALDSAARAKARALEEEKNAKRALASKMADVVSDLHDYMCDDYSDNEDVDVRDNVSIESGLDVSISPRSLTPAISPKRSMLELQRPGSSATATPPPRSTSVSRASNQSGSQQRSMSPRSPRSSSQTAEEDRGNVAEVSKPSSAVVRVPAVEPARQPPCRPILGRPGTRKALRTKRLMSGTLEEAALKVRGVLLSELKRQIAEADIRKQLEEKAEDEKTVERKPRICFEQQESFHALPMVGVVDPQYVRDRYIELCKIGQCKPNSLALAKLNNMQLWKDETGAVGKVYDFSNALLGDRGCICLLQAIAEDPHCKTLSLKGCGLKGASIVAAAAFLELHPLLNHLDLSNNSFSYDAGEQILEALVHRSQGQSRDEVYVQPGRSKQTTPYRQSVDSLPKLHEVTVNLGGTWFAWDRAGQLTTCGPPCGYLWTGNAVQGQRRFAPSVYERLRNQLDDTHHIKYEDSLGKTGRPEAPDEEADTFKNWALPPPHSAGLTKKYNHMKRNTAYIGNLRSSGLKKADSRLFGGL